MAAALCEAGCCALGVTYCGRRRGSIPFTASNTEAETIAATRVVTRGLVPPVITVSFIIPIHSRTGSGLAAAADAALAAINVVNVTATIHRDTQEPRSRLIDGNIYILRWTAALWGGRSRRGPGESLDGKNRYRGSITRRHDRRVSQCFYSHPHTLVK